MEGENKSIFKDPQFLLGLFGGIAVISIIGMIILGLMLISGNKGGSVASATDSQTVKANATNPSAAAAAANIPKSSKPVVELFVMSHCPYGTQMEKGIIPVVEQLGNKISFAVKFVYYSMHGAKEVNEELNQYCIEKEQNGKYFDYLKCFLGSGDGQSCLASTGIDSGKLSACTQSADQQFSVTKNLNDQASWLSGQFPLVNLFKADNDKYGVGGSPTLIINGTEAKVGRDSQSLLTVICGAFTSAPGECSGSLSSQTPSAGFGTGAAAGSSGAACGN